VRTPAKWRFLATLWAGKLIAWAISVVFPDRGTNMSGELACRLTPGFMAGFSGIDPARTIMVTGTNGKSTSNNLIVHALRTAGRTVATNLEGANLVGGIATTLIKNSTWTGRLKQEYLMLEVDERNLREVRAYLPARYLAVTNIQKDQVQRNGDPDYIYRKILAAIDSDVTLFANNEEPRTLSLGGTAGRTVRYSVARNVRSWVGVDDEFAVALACPVCSEAMEFGYFNLANVGPFSCPGCGFSSSDKPEYCVDAVDYDRRRFSVNGVEAKLGLDAAHFLYDYVLCCAVVRELGVDWASLQRSFDSFSNVDGRLEEFRYRDKRIRYSRIKQENPETLQSAINDVAADPESKVVIFGLQLVHDIIPHYTNTAYAFDCDLGALFAGPVEGCLCFGATNCYEAAVRLIYAGFPQEKIRIVDSDDPAEILAGLDEFGVERAHLITMIGQYTAIRREAERVNSTAGELVREGTDSGPSTAGGQCLSVQSGCESVQIPSGSRPTLNVTWLYPDICNLHGDRGNLMALTRVCDQLGVDMSLTRVERLTDDVNLTDCDMVVVGPGELAVMPSVIASLSQGDALRSYVETGGVMLVVGTSAAIVANQTLRCDGSQFAGLGLVDMVVRERQTIMGDDLIISADGHDLYGMQIRMTDLELAPGQSYFGRTLYGIGNSGAPECEGARVGNLIVTNLLGPALAKNPWWAQSLVTTALARRSGRETVIPDSPDSGLRNTGVASSEPWSLERQGAKAVRRFTATKQVLPGVIRSKEL